MQKLIQKVTGKKQPQTVDAILSTFAKTIADLENHAVAMRNAAEEHTAAIEELQQQKETCQGEHARATQVAEKIRNLLS